MFQMSLTDVLLPIIMLSAAAGFALGGEPPVKHPNLLLNREELDQLKIKIAENDWAMRLFEKIRKMADEGNQLETALVYAITGEKAYGDRVHQKVVSDARYWHSRLKQADLDARPEEFNWGEWGRFAWTYDLAWELLSDDERTTVEDFIRALGRNIIEGDKRWTTTPNLVFGKHHNIGLCGYAIGDRELIEWALSDPGAFGPAKGGFYPVLDSMIKDGHFWGEAPIYALHYDVHGMIALAEAARRCDGTDLYAYVSPKSGASIKNIVDGYILMAFPLERTGINGGSVRMATFGDGSTCYGQTGELGDTFLVNPVSGRESDVTLCGELEAAYAHYKDPGYAWLLSLNPNRDARTVYGRTPWSYISLTHGVPALPANPTPPPAPCGIYPSQGFAVLRADESPAYWTSGGLAAVMRLGAAVGHGHEDYYSIVLHGKGRLLYPDVNVIQYEPTYLQWTREGIGHSTLMMDGRSPHAGEFTTRSEFTPETKFFAASGSAFDGTHQTRALLLTREYLADVFRVADDAGREHTYEWVLHGIGRLYEGDPAAYRASNELIPNYWWIDNERSRTADGTWQADWVQHGGGVTPGAQAFGKEWFEQTVGVRMTMLGSPGTRVFCGDGPIVDGPPHHRIDGNPEGAIPLVLARRKTAATTYVAVHEPYERKSTLTSVTQIAETDDAVGIVIEGAEFSDRVLMAFDAAKDCTLAGGDGESFAFRDYGYIRITGKQAIVRGNVSAFRLRTGNAHVAVTLNGKKAAIKREGEYIVFGAPPTATAQAKPEPDAPAERQACLHYYIMPEEIHLSAGGECAAELRIRCVGQGQATGKFKLVAPSGLSVEPAEIGVPAMAEGDEAVMAFRVKAAAEAARRLHTVRIQPADGAPAAESALPVSVGVVMTEDRLRPRLAEYVVRAPGYTMGVDMFSGVSYYLLDADGHRRFGRLHNTNFIFGFPGIMRDGKWCFCYRHPCRFIWRGANTLTVGCDGTYGDHDARLGYTFLEDRIIIKLIPPTRADVEHTMWLGNFDALGSPRKGTLQAQGNQPAADWYFFPHPIFRQGVLLTVPQGTDLKHVGTAVNLPVRTGQEVTLRFAAEEELPGE
ncbi:MAG TPA: heparinase II/III family protein [Planctomycetota bacterium]|nr:heparinase II/III family protein [Planctomycetota bacterium]